MLARACATRRSRLSKPVIFTISAASDDKASTVADAATLDELLEKISVVRLDLLSDNHPGVDPVSLFLQITALREVEPTAA
jgi:hypothetical protein